MAINTTLVILFCVAGMQSDDLPISAKVDSILIIVGVLLLLVEVFHTVGFNNHILSYSITDSYTSSVISISKLYSKQPLWTYKSIAMVMPIFISLFVLIISHDSLFLKLLFLIITLKLCYFDKNMHVKITKC